MKKPLLQNKFYYLNKILFKLFGVFILPLKARHLDIANWGESTLISSHTTRGDSVMFWVPNSQVTYRNESRNE